MKRRLEEQSSGHRVLILRTGAVIAVTSVVAIAGAILIHLFMAGVIVIGMLIRWHGAGGGSDQAAGANHIGAEGGALILGSPLADSQRPGAGSPGAAISKATVPARAVVLPPLEPLPALATAEAIFAPDAAPPLPPDAGSLEPGNPVIVPPVLPKVVARVDVPPAITPATPQPNDHANAAAGAGSAAAALQNPGIAGRGNSDDGNDDEPLFNPLGGNGTKTVGEGGRVIGDAGRGSGKGFDRGLSAADRQIQILRQAADPDVPITYRAKLIGKKVDTAVKVEADGTVSGVRVTGSCGIAEVDEICRQDILLSIRCSPRIQGGKPIADELEYGIDFGPPE